MKILPENWHFPEKQRKNLPALHREARILLKLMILTYEILLIIAQGEVILFFCPICETGASPFYVGCHLTFAFVLPMFKGNAVGGIIIAYATILVLGASFSLVPASLWPSVPKLVDAKVIGSAYALIFWIQNIGLWLFPLLIGKVLDATNPGVTDPTQFNYTAPLVMLASLGVAALLLGLLLKVVDKKKGIGLEEPNIKA